MATACILMVIAAILVWNSGSCNARPRYEHSSEQIFDDTENDLKGTPTKTVPRNKTSQWNYFNSRIVGSKKVIIVEPDDSSKPPEFQLMTATSSTTSRPTHKPVLDRDRVLDQLHDHTGYKTPIYHSALDGWLFG